MKSSSKEEIDQAVEKIKRLFHRNSHVGCNKKKALNIIVKTFEERQKDCELIIPFSDSSGYINPSEIPIQTYNISNGEVDDFYYKPEKELDFE